MSENNIVVKYLCQHPSCQVFCKKGELELEGSNFEELKLAYEDDDIFKSPRGVCKMGYNQPFKIVNVREADVASQEVEERFDSSNPIHLLKAEHKSVLATIERVEKILRLRDIDGVWTATADLENEITLHSVKKEEEALFPVLAKRTPLSHSFMQIVHEDHKEFISLLHSFRCGMQDDTILDGIVNSLLTNIKNHIRKENDEFFSMAEDHLTDSDKAAIVKMMKTLEDGFVPVDPGKRSDKTVSPFLVNRRMLDKEMMISRQEMSKADWSCH